MRGIETNVPNITHRTQYPSVLTEVKTDGGKSFSDILGRVMENVAGADFADKTSNIGLVTGTLDNLHTATIAAEKAEIMLNLTVQVRNRMVEAYQEVMRMPM